MHKRARNHKIKVTYEKLRKKWVKVGNVWAWPIVEDYKGGSENYEPQGKCEARKFFTKIIRKGLRDISSTK